MIIDKNNPSHYVADNGKVFKRISDGLDRGSDINLGYTYYIGGVKLNEPKLETIDDYIEIDKINQ